MISGSDLTDLALSSVRRFGYLAIFVFSFLETSMLFPFLPSEVVVPFAAAVLVDGPLSFAAFVFATATGATLGSLFAYYVVGRGGHRAFDDYGGALRVSARDLDRGRRWFRRWGESSVLWGRLFPILRSVISIPAGFAGMAPGKFALYSFVGSALFNAGVAAAVYYGKQQPAYDLALAWLRRGFRLGVDAATSNPLAVAILLALLALLAALLVAALRLTRRLGVGSSDSSGPDGPE
ncbi:DedA family protein [Halegenticoccus tardaugens]|uniref:DedA family protein n=1 Tax=Halegenticoccus tardaugens TaxID=2071624 RepID=UPI00100BCA71|nr:DedA family protein [Halegenticoccus tardaugens]